MKSTFSATPKGDDYTFDFQTSKLSCAQDWQNGQSRGVVTPPLAVGVDRNDTSSNLMVGEALAYVQGSGLKASAVV